MPSPWSVHSNAQLARLAFELSYRQQLLNKISSTATKTGQVKKEKKKLEQSMLQLPTVLQRLAGVSQNLEQLMNVTATSIAVAHEKATNLPTPLYTLFAQLEAAAKFPVAISKYVCVPGLAIHTCTTLMFCVAIMVPRLFRLTWERMRTGPATFWYPSLICLVLEV